MLSDVSLRCLTDQQEKKQVLPFSSPSLQTSLALFPLSLTKPLALGGVGGCPRTIRKRPTRSLSRRRKASDVGRLGEPFRNDENRGN